MPRTKPKETAPAPNSLVASAARIRGGRSMGLIQRSTAADGWHTESWAHYRNIGEYRYACDWIGGMLSKAQIYATVETVDGVEKVEDAAVLEYLSALFGNADGRAEMFRLIGIHMSVTGECHIVGYPDPDPFGEGGDKWEVAASTKVVRPATDSPNDPWKVNDVTLTDVDPDTVMCVRIWRPDPLEPQLSISPTRSVLPVLRQLHKLGLFIDAQLDSRLAGAGILLMPDTMQLPPAPAKDGDQPAVKSANNAEELMAILMEAMMASLQNQDDASAKVPIVVTASAESIAAVKHMTFWSELDEHAIELRKEAIGRLALGMDVPPEVLQGASDSNHWSAWQADESAIKAHAEPLLKIITTSLGSHYLRPLLSEDEAFADQRLSAYSIAADTSEMRLRPNRSKEALELYNLGELNGIALRRETGFDETDAMNPEQLANWLTRKVASGSTTPEYVEAALAKLGVTLNVIRPEEPAGETQEGRPAPSLVDHPANDMPEREVSERRKEARGEGRVPSADVERKASLMLGAEQAVFRALERTGNRMRNKVGGKAAGMPPAGEMYLSFKADIGDLQHYLEDAFGANVVVLAAHAEVDPGELVDALDSYCRLLLMSGQPHDFVRMCNHIEGVFKQNGVFVNGVAA